MSRALIMCKVDVGLFDSEYYVRVNGSAAYYVDKSNVVAKSPPTKGHTVDGKVVGYVVARKGHKVLVQLPGEAVVGGLRTWVDDSAVKSARR